VLNDELVPARPKDTVNPSSGAALTSWGTFTSYTPSTPGAGYDSLRPVSLGSLGRTPGTPGSDLDWTQTPAAAGGLASPRAKYFDDVPGAPAAAFASYRDVSASESGQNVPISGYAPARTHLSIGLLEPQGGFRPEGVGTAAGVSGWDTVPRRTPSQEKMLVRTVKKEQ
jgi:hypothetical protein